MYPVFIFCSSVSRHLGWFPSTVNGQQGPWVEKHLCMGESETTLSHTARNCLEKKKLKAILTSLLLVLPAEVTSIYTMIFFSFWLWVTFFFFVTSLVIFLILWILDIRNVKLLNIWMFVCFPLSAIDFALTNKLLALPLDPPQTHDWLF